VKVVILCGGKGTRLEQETDFKPKPMVEIGGRPILWHIMNIYSYYGFKDFVLCLGYKGEKIREYFINYGGRNSICINRTHSNIEFHIKTLNWTVNLAYTGEESQTGARIKKIEEFIKQDSFMVTYGDGVANINIGKLVKFHKKQGTIATVTGVHPASRFGELIIKNDKAVVFSEKPQTSQGYINGGFFVFNKNFFRYVNNNKDCSLEGKPLEKLAKTGELSVYKHNDYWQCMDTRRELMLLRNLWKSGNAPWRLR